MGRHLGRERHFNRKWPQSLNLLFWKLFLLRYYYYYLYYYYYYYYYTWNFPRKGRIFPKFKDGDALTNNGLCTWSCILAAWALHWRLVLSDVLHPWLDSITLISSPVKICTLNIGIHLFTVPLLSLLLQHAQILATEIASPVGMSGKGFCSGSL